MKPFSAVVTTQAQNCANKQRGYQEFPISASGEGGKTAHKSTRAEGEEAEVGDDAHDEGEYCAPHTPIAKSGEEGTECYDGKAAEDTGHIGENGALQTGKAMLSAGEVGGASCKTSPAQKTCDTGQIAPDAAEHGCGNAERKQIADFLHGTS